MIATLLPYFCHYAYIFYTFMPFSFSGGFSHWYKTWTVACNIYENCKLAISIVGSNLVHTHMEFIFQVLHLIFNASHPHKAMFANSTILTFVAKWSFVCKCIYKGQAKFIVSHQHLPLLGTHPITFHYCPWALTGWGDPGMEGWIQS